MFQHSQQFQQATELFYSMQYQQGLQLINQCIIHDRNNSILYSNRALFYSQLGLIDEAFNDLNIAIELNYLNYIGYFNMFSLLMRCQRFQQAFQNLCCSLSCLYLIQAKTKKSELDASKAIKYAQNNLQAHVLKGLIHLQNGKYKLALNQLQWACQINPKNDIVKNIKQLIYKKMNPGLDFIENDDIGENVQQQQHKNKDDDNYRIIMRLQSSYTYEQGQREQQLRDRINQFNQIYNKLNQYQGTITTKVPKQYQQQTQKNQHNNQQLQGNLINEDDHKDSYRRQQAQQQEQLNIGQEQHQQQKEDQNNVNINNKEIQQRQQRVRQNIQQDHHQYQDHININDTSRLSSGSGIIDNGAATPSQMSLAPQPGQYPSYYKQQTQSKISLQQQDNFSQFHSINHPISKQQISSTTNSNIEQFQSMMIQSNLQNNRSQCQQQSQQSRIINIHDDIEENFQSVIKVNSLEQQKQQQQQQDVQQTISQITNNLYPRPDNALLQFSILKLQILQKSSQQINKLQNLYCIANYLISNEKSVKSSNFKLRTACRKGNINGTQWNQTFQPIPIPQHPQCMKIKVYNKKYSSYRDDLIGQMQVEITTHGLVKLPLFNKNGQLTATLLMNLQLVIKQEEEDDVGRQDDECVV